MSRRGLAALPARGRLALLGCFVAQMGLGTAYVLGPMLKHVVAEFDWSRTVYSIGNAPLLLAMALGNSLVGDLTERFGARRVLGTAALLLGASLWCFAHVQSLAAYYASCALFGVALAGVGDIPVGAVASRWVAQGGGLALGLVYIGSNSGGAVVPYVLDALARSGSWRTALVWIGAVAVAWILPVTLLLVREPEAAGAHAGPLRAQRDPAGERGLDLPAALRTRSFWLLAAVLFAFYLYYLAVNLHLVPYLTDLGWSDARAAASYGGAVAVGILAKLGIGVVADRLSLRRALLANFALLAAASLLLLAVRAPGALPAFLFAHGFATAAENVLLPMLVADCFGLRHMPRIYGALMLTLFAGGALGPILAGAAFDRFGDYRVAFGAFAALNVLALLLLPLVRREAGPEA
jgi:MFS family permease